MISASTNSLLYLYTKGEESDGGKKKKVHVLDFNNIPKIHFLNCSA